MAQTAFFKAILKRSAMFHESETWCLWKNEMVVLRRTKQVVMRAMCGVRLNEKKSSEKLVDLLALEETLDRLAKANGMQSYRHVKRSIEF